MHAFAGAYSSPDGHDELKQVEQDHKHKVCYINVGNAFALVQDDGYSPPERNTVEAKQTELG